LDGGILLGLLLTLPIRSARSIELTRLFGLTAGCLAEFEGGVLVGLFTLLMIDALRLVDFLVDLFFILDGEVDCRPITLPICWLFLELIRLL
jgi:hypothetical protein